MPVEIFGCGLNAHGQLNSPGDDNSNNDSFKFKSILTADSAKVLYAGWSDTLISYKPTADSPTQRLLLGLAPTPTPISLPSGVDLHNFFGTTTGLVGALSHPSDQLHLFSPGTTSFIPHGAPDSNPRITHLAATLTSRLAIAIRPGPASHLTHVLEFASPEALATWYADPTTSDPAAKPVHHMLGGRCAQLVATATCFVFLTEAGEVWTWGDARHGRVLGWSTGEESPAEKPGRVDALAGVPMGRVAGGGYVAAGVSREGDAYVWGQGKPGGKGVIRALEAGEDEEDVKLVDLEGGADVRGVAVGNGHVVVVDEKGGVFVAGENENGQLGLGEDVGEWVADWKRVEGLDGDVLDVVCGARTSFLLLQKL